MHNIHNNQLITLPVATLSVLLSVQLHQIVSAWQNANSTLLSKHELEFNQTKQSWTNQYSKLGSSMQIRKLLTIALPRSDQDVVDAMKSSIPQKRQTDTKYCITIFEKWRSHRQDIVPHSSIPPLDKITENELNYWLPRFILEIR